MSVTTWDAATTAAVRAELVNQLWDGYEPDSPEDAAELVQQLRHLDGVTLVERLAQALLYTTDDKNEGTDAFLNKRPPQFRGR